MKKTRIILAALLFGVIQFADAQYYYGPPGPPPGPPPRRERREKQEDQPAYGTPTGYVEISLGLASPVGDFSNEGGVGYHGYALTGDNLAISLAIPINHSNFGIALMYSAYNNPFDVDGYINNVQYSNPGYNYYIPTDYYGNPYDAGASYSESFIMAGLFATLPVQRLSFDFRLMGGVAICSLPEITYAASATSAAATNDFLWDIAGSSTTGFAVDIGAGIRYQFRRAAIMFGIDFMSADPMISTTQTYTDQYGTNTFSHIGGNLPISLMSYSIGIGYPIR
ncbi:MAG TPA: hypothetical protein VK783_04685 [Bacteroidia bacterium]|jgi:hypothetical protein|nr:hypothetical protein [Bacteroidia bacterium]